MKKSIRAYLLDDEMAIPAILENLFHLYCPEVEVVGKACDWKQALDEIPGIRPDVLFLDIRMPGATGFEFLKMLPDRKFEVVMVTGYQDHALEAIKAEALDYLLKPVDHLELKETLDKLKKRMQATEPDDVPDSGFLHAHRGTNVERIPISEIVCISAQNNYCLVEMANGDQVLFSKTLKKMEEELAHSNSFIRLNRELVIHVKFIRRYSKQPPFEVQMTNGKAYPISRRRKIQILKAIGSLNPKTL
jgi:two-component system, LytTR family, response regulator